MSLITEELWMHKDSITMARYYLNTDESNADFPRTLQYGEFNGASSPPWIGKEFPFFGKHAVIFVKKSKRTSACKMSIFPDDYIKIGDV